jgi:hypothetical protein
MSEMPVEGLKSTSEEVLLLGLRFGLAETGDEVVEFVGKGSGDDSGYEDGNAWWEVLAFSGVTVVSRFNRASRRALSFKARWTSCKILGSIQKWFNLLKKTLLRHVTFMSCENISVRDFLSLIASQKHAPRSYSLEKAPTSDSV